MSQSYRPLMVDKDFITIGFTTPYPWNHVSEEAHAISLFLESDALDFFHIRKPDADSNYTTSLLSLIPARVYPRLILHSHFILAQKFTLGGIHCKPGEADPYIPDYTAQGRMITKSCHSLSELMSEHPSDYSYRFLSPVFNSISKKGYSSGFNIDDPRLLEAVSRGPTIALGGVKPLFFEKIFNAKFAGAALLGYLWSPKFSLQNKIDSIISSRIQN